MKFDSNMIIGNRIKFYRGSKGLKQEELAEKVSISNTQMSNLECGKAIFHTKQCNGFARNWRFVRAHC